MPAESDGNRLGNQRRCNEKPFMVNCPLRLMKYSIFSGDFKMIQRFAIPGLESIRIGKLHDNVFHLENCPLRHWRKTGRISFKFPCLDHSGNPCCQRTLVFRMNIRRISKIRGHHQCRIAVRFHKTLLRPAQFRDNAGIFPPIIEGR